jgi:hypothetical protein
MLTDSNGEGILFFVTGLPAQVWKETANVAISFLILNKKEAYV